MPKGNKKTGMRALAASSSVSKITPKSRANSLKNSMTRVSAPVASSRTMKFTAPMMKSSGNGNVLIRHREYIQDITSGSGTPSVFSIAANLPINPGQATSFPWLSSIAQRFESYRFRKLNYLYETEAPTSLGGTLIMTVDYDASDAAPATKQQAMTYKNYVRCAPWVPSMHSSSVGDLHKALTYYVRPGAQPANTDIKTYDAGNLFVITQNVTTAGTVCGELHVEYEVELMTPVYEQYLAVYGGQIVGGGSLSGANPFGTVPVPDTTNFGISMGATSVLTFANPGTYQVNVSVQGTTLSAFSAVLSGGTIKGNSGNVINSAASSLIGTYPLVTTGPNATLTISLTAVAVSASQLQVGVAPLSSLN